jgi:hypothetical protein
MNITHCPRCNQLYEESSEEDANSPERACRACRNQQTMPAAAALKAIRLYARRHIHPYNLWADAFEATLAALAARQVELAWRDAEIERLRYQRDGLRDAARELLARLDSSPERVLMAAAIAASEDK